MKDAETEVEIGAEAQTESQKLKQAILEEFKARQTAFLSNNQPTFGDMLENAIRTFLSTERSQLNQHLEKYSYPEALRLNTLEVILAPIVQLAETKGFGAAVIFAERIKKYDSTDYNYIELFNEQISKVKITNLAHNKTDSIHLQITLANLINMFTSNYSLYALHSNKMSPELFNKEKEGELRNDLSVYVVAVVSEILFFLHQYAQSEKINLKKLKQKFLKEESKSSPDKQWEERMKLSEQLQSDSVLAITYVEENFEAIDNEIMHWLDEQFDAVKLELWLAKGIAFITNFNHIAIFHNLEAFPVRQLYARFNMDERLKEQLHRYVDLRLKINSLRKLAQRGVVITLENIASLKKESYEFLNYYLDRKVIYFSRELPFFEWTVPMLDNIEKIFKFFNLFPESKGCENFTSYSSQQLNTYLDILLKDAKQPEQVKACYEHSRKIIEQSSIEIYLFRMSLPGQFFNFIKYDQDTKTIALLFGLSQDAKKELLSRVPSRELLFFIRELACSNNPYSQAILEIVTSSSYLLSKADFKDQPEIAFIASSSVPIVELKTIFCSSDAKMIEHLKMVFGSQGLECNARNYCSFADQLRINPDILNLLQEIMLKNKAPVKPKIIELLSSPEMISATKAKFFDGHYIASCTIKEIKEIASFSKKAIQRGISDVWDPKFCKFIQSQRHSHSEKSTSAFFKPHQPIATPPRQVIKNGESYNSSPQ